MKFFAKWIAAAEKFENAPIFRKHFQIDKPIKSAKLYISGLGCYIGTINGESFGACAMTVASTLLILYPPFAIISPTFFNSSKLSASLKASSVSGKCFPISPRAHAPKSESAIAWSKTSASE